MIYVNGKKVEFGKFPDGTASFKLDKNIYSNSTPSYTENIIEWHYEGDHECILLYYIVSHIRENYNVKRIILHLPYIPNARMDRVKNTDEIFTLKWFANFINSMNFDKVYVQDPHSNVSTALINNIVVENNIPSVIYTIAHHIMNIEQTSDLMYCYPDEGSAKRYSDMLKHDYVFCIKHRDWNTGKILNLELTNKDKVKDKNILIIDDICSKGGTFTYTAKALKEAGANHIYLYVTHCENTIIHGSVLIDGLIEHVYTTDSIFTEKHDKVTVI